MARHTSEREREGEAKREGEGEREPRFNPKVQLRGKSRLFGLSDGDSEVTESFDRDRNNGSRECSPLDRRWLEARDKQD